MLSFIRNKYHWLFASRAPEWLKARSRDLSGPHPKRLKPFRFVFQFEGIEGLAVDIPLPPYQHDYDLPPLDIFSREILGKWDAPEAKRTLVVDDVFASARILELQERRVYWFVKDTPAKWRGTQEEQLKRLESIRRDKTINLVNADLVLYVGTKRFPWRFAEFKIKIDLLADGGYLSKDLQTKRAEEENEKNLAQGNFGYFPVRADGDVLFLRGACGLRFRTRLLESDEVKAWSVDRTMSTKPSYHEYVLIPLSDKRVLRLDFSASPASEPPWRWQSRALQVIEAILYGMRFYGPWPRFQEGAI